MPSEAYIQINENDILLSDTLGASPGVWLLSWAKSDPSWAWVGTIHGLGWDGFGRKLQLFVGWVWL